MKIILDLCGGTGAWSRPYEDAGYDVRIITLPEQDVRDYIPPSNVYGILAAPPCTEFSLARNFYSNKKPRDFKGGLSVVDACMRIIWRCDPSFWALENPIGMLSNWLGQNKYFFHPWWFGDPWTKRTALWGNFNPPPRIYFDRNKVMTEEQISKCQKNLNMPHIYGSGEKRAAGRAITPPGFAKTFFRANQ